MAAPFKCDEKVTIEHNIGGVDPVYGTAVANWQPLLARYWANVEDELPSRAEDAANGIETRALRSRLRMQGAGAVTGEMRAVLHSRGNRVMGIIAGPSMLNDRTHYEFKLEAYGG